MSGREFSGRSNACFSAASRSFSDRFSRKCIGENPVIIPVAALVVCAADGAFDLRSAQACLFVFDGGALTPMEAVGKLSATRSFIETATIACRDRRSGWNLYQVWPDAC